MLARLKKAFGIQGTEIEPQSKRRYVPRRTFNCARVYLGFYVGGGTNEDERDITCSYRLVEGLVAEKRLKPIRVRWTTSEGQTSILKTIVIYPKTETADIIIKNSRGTHRLRLVKAEKGQRSVIYKASL